MTTTKQKLIDKLAKRKKNAEEQKYKHTPETFIAFDPKENKVVMEILPTFKFILHAKRELAEICIDGNVSKVEDLHYIQRNSILAYMKGMIKDHVKERIKEMSGFPAEEFQKTAYQIYVNISAQWLKYHLDSLPHISMSAIKQLQNAKITTLGNHTLFICEEKTTRAQTMIDFIGLCWLRDFQKRFGVQDIGRDIIVGSSGYLWFFAMELCFQFQKQFLSQPEVSQHLKEMAPPTEEHAIALVEGYEELKYPSMQEQNIMTNYLTCFATWKHYYEAMEEN